MEKKFGIDDQDGDYTDERYFRRLIRSIEVSKGYYLFFVACNQIPRQNELIADIKAELPTKNIEVINFKEPITDLLFELETISGDEKPDAIFVQGLGNSISSDGTGDANNLIYALNISRDSFNDALPCPMYLWLPEYAVIKITRHAPDFFSVRSGVFYFSSTAEQVISDIFQNALATQHESEGLNLADKQSRIKILEDLFAEYQSLPDEKRDNLAELRLLHQLTEILLIIGEYDRAIKYATKALSISQLLGEETKENAESYNYLAVLFKSQGRYEEAEPLYKKALAINEKKFGENHPETATSYNNLALLYRLQGRFDTAKPLLKKALAINEKEFGENHPETATSYNNLALLYKSQGRFDNAEPFYIKALAVREKVLGESHPSTAISYNNLAGLYESQSRYEDSEFLYKKSLAICRNVLGENHPDTAQSYNNLGWLYEAKGEYGKAKEYLEKALVILQNVLGDNHPNIISSRQSLERIKRTLGDLE